MSRLGAVRGRHGQALCFRSRGTLSSGNRHEPCDGSLLVRGPLAARRAEAARRGQDSGCGRLDSWRQGPWQGMREPIRRRCYLRLAGSSNWFEDAWRCGGGGFRMNIRGACEAMPPRCAPGATGGGSVESPIHRPSIGLDSATVRLLSSPLVATTGERIPAQAARGGFRLP